MLIFFFIAAGAVLVAADQLVKYWAVTELMPVRSMDFIKIGGLDILGLYYTENDGAAFSIFSGARHFLIVFNIVLMAGLIIFTLSAKKKDKLMLAAATLIVSGGIGNIIDRIRLGYVVDYLEVRLFKFAVFNFADICIVIGAFLLAFYVIYSEFKDKRKDIGRDNLKNNGKEDA